MRPLTRLLPVVAVLAASAPASADPTCVTPAAFNTAMATGATSSADVTVTFDVTGINPADFFNSKGSLAQLRHPACGTAAGTMDAGVKVYGTSDPPNTTHPAGSLKYEYGTTCCGYSPCPERWADGDWSAQPFQTGAEQCSVSVWVRPTSIGYHIACAGGTLIYDAESANPDNNLVSEVWLLEFHVPDGGVIWQMPNATATNAQVCYVPSGTGTQTLTVPVMEDATVAAATPTTVYTPIAELEVEPGALETYLKFQVPAIAGQITQTRLFLHSLAGNSGDGSGGSVFAVADTSWSEAALTWSAKPAHGATALGHIGPFALDQWASVDVSAAVTQSGTHAFAVVAEAGDTNSTHFYSKEGSTSLAAYLLVSYVLGDFDGGVADAGTAGDAGPGIDAGVAGDGGAGDGAVGDGGPGDGGPAGDGGGQGEVQAQCNCGASAGPGAPLLILATLVGFALLRRRQRAG